MHKPAWKKDGFCVSMGASMDLYSSVKRGTFGVAVGGSLFRDGKLLVMRRAPTKKVAAGMWETPGGKIEFGESWEEALKREWREEAGVDVVPRKVFHVWSWMGDEHTQFFTAEFLVEVDPNAEITLSDEHDDMRWIARKEIDTLPFSDEMRPAISRAFDAAGL